MTEKEQWIPRRVRLLTIGLVLVVFDFSSFDKSVLRSESFDIPPCRNPHSGSSGSWDRVSLSEKLPLPLDDAMVYRVANRFAIEVEFDSNGRLSCASPLAGSSVLWPHAIEWIRQNAGRYRSGKRTIFTGETIDPFHFPARPCEASDAVEVLLRRGGSLLGAGRKKEAAACFDQALQLQPDSVAALYGAARSTGRGQESRCLQLLEKVIERRPWFDDARCDRAFALGRAGQPQREEEILTTLSVEQYPVPTRRRALSSLLYTYDQQERRDKALPVKQALVAIEQEFLLRSSEFQLRSVLGFDLTDLGVRLEENRSDPREALRAYKEAGPLAEDDAYRFKAALGQIRCLRKMGEENAVTAECETWRKRLASPQVRKQLDNLHWEGRLVARGNLEVACGDFSKGIATLEKAAQRARTSDGPYRSLEVIFRTRQDRQRAQHAKEQVKRIQKTNDAAVLATLKEAFEIYRSVETVK